MCKVCVVGVSVGVSNSFDLGTQQSLGYLFCYLHASLV